MPAKGTHAFKTEVLIRRAVEIIAEIQPTTCRAVGYKLLGEGLIRTMGHGGMAKVQRAVRDARLEDRIPWEWIVDNTRPIYSPGTYADRSDFARVFAGAYRVDPWPSQPRLVEVWSEKNTVAGVVEPVLDEFRVVMRVLSFASWTRINEIAEASKRRPILALYVGDYDPSGTYMSEVDLPKRLEQRGADVEIRRLGVGANDLRKLARYSVPVKPGDGRLPWWQGLRRGERCLELDALSPDVLRARVRAAVEAEVDGAAWKAALAGEASDREAFATALDGWARSDP
ncbi:MAG TPA: hypothetical protein VMX54_10050 [Vicinamibacteria bacterium]|nr:hypothetical protein [Vicinamibacteria bacterium]